MEDVSVNSDNSKGDDNTVTAHSLRSLVSSDESIDSLERCDNVPTTIHCAERKLDWDAGTQYCTKMSIIACSSPEIKALVQSIPPYVQCYHQISLSALSLFPGESNSGEIPNTNTEVLKILKCDKEPIVWPDASHTSENTKFKSSRKLNMLRSPLIDRTNQANSDFNKQLTFNDRND